ncbi:DNA-binding protein [Bifidobacterium eulemuris]|uniref:DNA-binding protein n=2 Tax=Bifidobacterium eulemuris TaxID=1765219 RepID=A0A261G1F9_9BIFI|nr:DNA-binding protein [Bifidobacterium eulemuris]
MSLPTQESLTIEFKSETSRAISNTEIVDNVVALSNTDGGDLFLGIEDDGTPTGVAHQHRNIDQLAAYLFNHTVPPIQVRPSLIQADDKTIVRISVDASTQLICSNAGRVTHRVIKMDGTPEVVTMYPYEFVSRLSSIGQYDYSAQPAPGARLDDLDAYARDALREQILSSGADTSLLELDDATFDGALGFRTNNSQTGESTPTITGLLMIGEQQALKRCIPTATVVFQVMRDGAPAVDETLQLPLTRAIPRLNELMQPWNHATERMVGMTQQDIMDYNRDALREAMLNALCHRDYSMLAPVHIQLDEIGLTISSPGGFMRGIDASNLLTVTPTPRNRALTDALKRCGYVERTGRGVDRIYAGSAATGRPFPDYSQSTNERVVVFLRKSTPDARFMDMLDQAQQRRGTRLNTEDFLVMAAIRATGQINITEIRQATTLDLGRITAALEALVADGTVTCDADLYSLADSPDTAVDIVVTSNNASPSTDRDRNQILSLAKSNNGIITTRQVMELFDINYLTAYRLLKNLQDDGILTHDGKGRYSRFLLHA